MKPLTLPWTGRDVPHANLDINRGCNIRCRTCYNARLPARRALAEIEADLDTMLSLRRLHTVTISGGEPLLHPQLVAIVRAIRRRGLRVALASNGLDFTGDVADGLARAGLDLVLFHIDPDQERPDLPDATNRVQLRALREAKIGIAAAHGIAAGLLSTAFADRMDDVAAAVRLALDTPELRYLVFTGHVDFPGYGGIDGSLENGLRLCSPPARSVAARQMTNAACANLMRERFAARPFAILPSHGALRYDAWLSFQAAAVYEHDRAIRAAFVESSLVERLGLRLLHLLHGRYPFFHDESPRTQRTQLLLNALAGGAPACNTLALSRRRSQRLVLKHIVFQQGPTAGANGNLTICRDCPDAVLVAGRFLPVCLADRIKPGPRPAAGN